MALIILFITLVDRVATPQSIMVKNNITLSVMYSRYLLLLFFMGINCLMVSNINCAHLFSNSKNNVCTRTQSYEVQVPIQTIVPITVTYTKFCLKNVKFQCKKQRTEHRTENFNKTEIRQRVIEECCLGFERVDNHCVGKISVEANSSTTIAAEAVTSKANIAEEIVIAASDSLQSMSTITYSAGDDVQSVKIAEFGVINQPFTNESHSDSNNSSIGDISSRSSNKLIGSWSTIRQSLYDYDNNYSSVMDNDYDEAESTTIIINMIEHHRTDRMSVRGGNLLLQSASANERQPNATFTETWLTIVLALGALCTISIVSVFFIILIRRMKCLYAARQVNIELNQQRQIILKNIRTRNSSLLHDDKYS